MPQRPPRSTDAASDDSVQGAAGGGVADVTVADFAKGTCDGAHVAITADGPELILHPTVAAEFGCDTLPDDWYAEPWKEGGRATVVGSSLVLDGASAGHYNLVGSERSLEFVATFQKRPHQHVGFGTDFRSSHWVTFSTKFGNALYARSSFFIPEDNRLSPGLLGSPHRFRIDWNILDVDFWIDGRHVAHQLVPMVGYLRPLASNGSLGGPPLTVDWLRMTPYRPSGTFTSRVHDAGTTVHWTACALDADIPPNTSVEVELRGGDTPEPDGSWSAWVPVHPATGLNGAALAARYAQYRLLLHTRKSAHTPLVRAVTLRYSIGKSTGGAGGGAGGASSSSSSSSSTPLIGGGTSGS
jgi:hypothetical protein